MRYFYSIVAAMFTLACSDVAAPSKFYELSYIGASDQSCINSATSDTTCAILLKEGVTVPNVPIWGSTGNAQPVQLTTSDAMGTFTATTVVRMQNGTGHLYVCASQSKPTAAEVIESCSFHLYASVSQ